MRITLVCTDAVSVLLRREYYASLSEISVVEIVRNIFDDTLSATPNPVATRLCYGTFDAQSKTSYLLFGSCVRRTSVLVLG